MGNECQGWNRLLSSQSQSLPVTVVELHMWGRSMCNSQCQGQAIMAQDNLTQTHSAWISVRLETIWYLRV